MCETPTQARQSVGKGGSGLEVRTGPPAAACPPVTSPAWLRVRSCNPISPGLWQSLPIDQHRQATVETYLPCWHKATPMLSYF